MNKKMIVFLLMIALGSLVLIYGLKRQISQTNENSQLTSAAATPTTVSVAATFYPLAEFAQQVGGSQVRVKNLTPAGTEPHDFEPTPKDLVELQQSQLFIYHGAGLELWLEKVDPVLKAQLQMVKATEGIPIDGNDPHVWLDPVLASQEVSTIMNALKAADPIHAPEYDSRAKDYQKQLLQLDADFQAGLQNCERKEIVTSHNAFHYLAKRYGLTVLSLSGLSPDEEPSPKKLAEVVQFVKKNHVTHIFFESLVSPKLSETIAHETGAQTLAFNPLEGLTEVELSQGQNYISVQRQNLAVLKIALACH